MALTRDRMDALCWKIMHERRLPKGDPSPPCNYAELGREVLLGAELEDAFDRFNFGFALHRRTSFFEVPPPAWLEPEHQAFLAGVAEFYSIEFDLPMPEWVGDPKYVLPEPWEPWGWMLPDDGESVQRRIEEAHPCFVNRNVIYQSRNLIVV